MLKIKNAALAASAVRRNQYPEEGLPLIALFGRSNAGKSSLINCLINRKNLARTSSAPGKTRLLNFYRVDGSLEQGSAAAGDLSQTAAAWYFVDLPGYGYAKVSKSEREVWLRMMEEFLRYEAPRRLWQLVDIRHQPSEQDVAMQQMLARFGPQPLIIANKTDKVSKNACCASLKVISQTLNVDKSGIIPFSAVSRQGREELLAQAEYFLAE